MQDTTTLSLPAAPAGAADVPPLAFRDAEGAAAWLKSLPMTSLGHVQISVLGQLQALATAEIAPRERARIAEILRDQVAYLHTELARRYAGKPQPAAEREHDAVEQILALWHALWEQYSTCLKPLLQGDPDLAGVKPKIVQRGLYVGKQLVLVHGLARRLPPAALWQELHAYYRLAELLECTVTAVSDGLMPHAVGLSCYSTYTHALLLALADPWAMSVKQIELTDRWLGMWSRKVFPYAQQRESEGPVIVIDLEAPMDARLVAAPPRQGAESLRFGYPGKLATSVRGRLKRLQSGAEPSELQLGGDCSVEQCTTLLGHLDAHWYQTPQRAQAASSEVELCPGGLGAAYFRVAGRTFDRTDPAERLSFQGSQHLQAIGALSEYDRGREDAERTWAWERWTGVHDRRDAALRRTMPTRHRWFLEELVVARDGERLRLGCATRVAQGEDALHLGLRMWSGAPRALPLRPVGSTMVEEPMLPCVLLPETPNDKACLVVPPRTFNPSRVLRTVDGGAEQRYRLTRLLQRGADFERVAFETPD